MSSEEVFVQQFAALFAQYRHALSLDTTGEIAVEPHGLGDLPMGELDRMVSAARLALLDIETNARELGHGEHSTT